MLFPRLRPSLVALAALQLCLGAQAQQDLTPGEEGAPRVAPGNRLERVEINSRPQSDTDLRRRAPVAKQLYGREELDKYGDNNVADVLKRLPGVDMQGGAPRMRGLGAGYTLILINGDPAPPGFDLSQLNPAQVERIEVSKGPTAEQSAQAVAGTINIILKDAPKITQRDLRIGAGYSAVRPTPGLNFSYGGRGGGLAYSLPVSLFEWRGQSDFLNERHMPGSDGREARSRQQGVQDNWGHGFNSAPRLNWKISEDESASLQAFLQKGYWRNRQTYVDSQATSNAVLDDDALNKGTWQNARLNAQWSRRIDEERKLELKLGAGDSRGTFDNQTFRDGAVRRRTVGDNHDQSITQSGKYAQLLGESHSVSLGWDLEWRRRDEDRTTSEQGQILLPDFDAQPFGARIRRMAWYLQDDWELSPQWSAYLGLRQERIRTESCGLASPVLNESSVLSPLLHLNYKFDAKGRELIRASLTRSYKAPDLYALMARPAISSLYPDLSRTNTELSPDRLGNPLLRPELATGLDLAYETYFSGGGMFSVGVFHRSVKDLIRNVATLQTVSWASAPRWVSQPQNLSRATSSGLELELKGRAGELLPRLFDAKLPLNLRAALNVYQSRVEALAGPNNRLEGQQPWSANLGFDYRFSSMPLNTGASFAYTPGYATQQTDTQSLQQSRTRSLDWFAVWSFSRQASLRVGVNNIAPLDSWSETQVAGGYGSRNERSPRSLYTMALELKL